MSRPLQVMCFIALVAFTVTCADVSYSVTQIQRSLPATQKQLTQLLTDADRTTIIVAGTMTNLEKETRQWKDQSLAQSQSATAAASQLNSDLQVLGTLLATANSTLMKQDASLTNLEQQAGESIAATRPILSDLTATSDAFAKEVPPILQNVNDSTAQTVLVSQNVSDTTKSMDASAHDIQAFIHRETSPVTGTWNVIKGFLREFAGPAAQVATAIK
jgi:type VI protein secretion system component VasK